jgi:thymidylate synthase (FAD)
MKRSEEDYMFLITDQELKPEEARSVLPNDCKTELVVTMFESDWQHFFELRCSPAAHPDIRELANKLKVKMNEKGYNISTI